ncbi:IMPA1 [Ecytonucleospora hepatopenaei]|uniref:Importin subunit alpha n=1 Tax=Ecytonucleospora hepatopenaei TaxID=646526 RepID=A0A1W0E3X4_9MICR|nr:IMPA1 [Ecytonucleospora hepatopenaei]
MTNSKKQLQEQQATLRKIRNEEMLKRSRSTKENENAKVLGEFSESVRKLYSPDLNEVYDGIYEIRLALSQRASPPVKQILDLKIMDRLVSLLNTKNKLYVETTDKHMAKNVLIETAWALTNICTGTHLQTKTVVDHNACPLLMEMFRFNDDEMVDQAIWCLGNIAGDCERFRDILTGLGAVETVCEKLKIYEFKNDKKAIFNNLLWFAGNLLRGKIPPPSKETMAVFLNIYEAYCNIEDEEATNAIFWGISYICDNDNDLMIAFTQSPIYTRFLELLNGYGEKLLTNTTNQKTTNLHSLCSYSLSPIVRTLGHLVGGSNELCDFVIKSGALNNIKLMFYKTHARRAQLIRKEICWALSNIIAGPEEHIQWVLDRKLDDLLLDSLGNYEISIRREAAHALYNLTHDSDNIDIAIKLINQNICVAIKKAIEAAESQSDIVMTCLDICINLLEAGEIITKRNGHNVVLDKMNETRLADLIEDCQDMRTDEISDKAYNIVMKYLGGEEESY